MAILPADVTCDPEELRRRLPASNARLSASVGATVEILRDRAGVPHIYAQSTGDLYFGLGVAMAQDRLWQMDRLRRRALGRQAEILGPAYIQSDLQHRAVGIPQIADREVQHIDAPTRGILERFVAGINRCIEEFGRTLPIEFALLDYEPEPFSVADCIAILRGEWWSLNGRLNTLAVGEAAKYLPEHLRAAFLTPEAPEHRILPTDAEYPTSGGLVQPLGSNPQAMGDATGSNNWAVAGWRTGSGEALLCSDPHQPFWVPSSWYEYVVHGPEDHAAGAGHPGVPGLWFGANGDIAWGITNNATSTRDLYREEVHPTDPNLYRDGESWRKFEQRIEEVAVRGEAPVRHVQRTTIRGPIVNHVVPAVDGEAPLSLRWVGQEHLDDVRACVAVGRARDWGSFRNALRDWTVPVFNFGYADKTGRIGYQCAGRVPIRARPSRGYRDANEPADAWTGYIPFDALPHSVDPIRGYVASANERVAPDDYPYAMHGSFGSGHRAARLHQALGASAAFDRDKATALQNDVKSCRAERLCPALVEHLALANDADVVLLREALQAWDYRYTTDSFAPTLFETFMDVWQERVARERFPTQVLELVKSSGGVAAELIERGDADLKWFSGPMQSELVAAARTTVERTRTQFGASPNEWLWGKVHQAHWRHPLGVTDFDIGPAPVDGGPDSVRNTGSAPPTLNAVGGAEYRLVVDFAQPEQFMAVQNIGNSGQPGSPHYADQFADWLAGRYHVVSLRRLDPERDAEGKTLLQPDRIRG
jgi:penicillin amidase